MAGHTANRLVKAFCTRVAFTTASRLRKGNEMQDYPHLVPARNSLVPRRLFDWSNSDVSELYPGNVLRLQHNATRLVLVLI